ncbi:MAG: hypothetical protein ACOYOB_03100 [Myxococcota bacterium]
MRAFTATTLTTVLALLLFAGCSTADKCADGGCSGQGYGTVAFALTGAFPGATKLTVKIYDAPLKDLAATASFVPASCQGYSESRNKLVISNLKSDTTYSLLVELYEDSACTKLRYRAYRGGITVKAGSGESVASSPYYLQPYQLGAFSSLATTPASLATAAGLKNCATDLDCKGIHPNATCSKSSICEVDHLFPLNGYGRRGFPVVTSLDDGRIAIVGGLNTLIDNRWAATVDLIEVFDPGVGLFVSRLVKNTAAVGLAESTTLTTAAFAQVGGTTRAKLDLVAGKSLTTGLDAAECADPAGKCPVSSAVTRWDLKGSSATALAAAIDAPLAFPAIGRVRTTAGDRLLIAGGAKVPASVALDPRVNTSMLCAVEAGKVVCPPASGPTLAVARARATVGCVETVGGVCKRLLIIGGTRQAAVAPLAEVYDGDTNVFLPVVTTGAAPATLHGGQILPLGGQKFLLLGASTRRLYLEDNEITGGGDLAPMLLTWQGGTAPSLVMAAAELGAFAGQDGGKRLLATTVSLADGSALLIGGIGPNLKTVDDALWFGADGQAKARIPLNVGRFGAGAARITGKGPLGGCVLLAGGFALPNGFVQPQNRVEVFCPSAP